MEKVLVDSCVLLDLFTNDVRWADWSENILENYSKKNILCINPIVFTEISIGFDSLNNVRMAIKEIGIEILEIPIETLFLTGKVFLSYRKNKGIKNSPLPDFFIGAHASVSKMDLITRDKSKYKTYFPNINLICP